MRSAAQRPAPRFGRGTIARSEAIANPGWSTEPYRNLCRQEQAEGRLDANEAQIASQKLGVEIAKKNFPATLSLAQSNLASAKANRAPQQANHDRQRSLPTLATTQQDVDATAANYQQANAQVEQAEARVIQELIRIDLANVRVNEQILDLVRVRQQNGLVTGLDTSRAAQQVEAIKAQLPQLQQQKIQQINAISLLLGGPPLALSQELVAGPSIPPVPPRVPVGVPSSLVMRRPDIRRAEANLHSAVAEIGVAEARFLPSVTLTGSPTVNSVDPGKLFRGSSLQYMHIGPSISIPLFEGGRQQQEAAIAYQMAVLRGWHDVVNALAALRGDEGRRVRLARQVAGACQALALSRARYIQGVEIFTTVLQASQTVLQAETNLSQATAADLDRLRCPVEGARRRLGDDLPGWQDTAPVPGEGWASPLGRRARRGPRTMRDRGAGTSGLRARDGPGSPARR